MKIRNFGISIDACKQIKKPLPKSCLLINGRCGIDSPGIVMPVAFRSSSIRIIDNSLIGLLHPK